MKGFYSIKRGDGSLVRLLKVKYPWKNSDGSEFIYKGKFGPKDTSWTEPLKKKVGYSKLGEGEFFMTVEAFKYACKSYMVGYLKNDWKNSFVEKRNAVNKRVYRFNFTITDADTAHTEIRSKSVVDNSAKGGSNIAFSDAAVAAAKNS